MVEPCLLVGGRANDTFTLTYLRLCPKSNLLSILGRIININCVLGNFYIHVPWHQSWEGFVWHVGGVTWRHVSCPVSSSHIHDVANSTRSQLKETGPQFSPNNPIFKWKMFFNRHRKQQDSSNNVSINPLIVGDLTTAASFHIGWTITNDWRSWS